MTSSAATRAKLVLSQASWRYVFAGLAVTALDLFLFLWLIKEGEDPIVAKLLAYGVAHLSGAALSILWTFRRAPGRGSRRV